MKVPFLVCEGIEEIRMSGLVDMSEPILVEQNFIRLGFDVAAEWISNNPDQYQKGIFEGFEISDETE